MGRAYAQETCHDTSRLRIRLAIAAAYRCAIRRAVFMGVRLSRYARYGARRRADCLFETCFSSKIYGM